MAQGPSAGLSRLAYRIGTPGSRPAPHCWAPSSPAASLGSGSACRLLLATTSWPNAALLRGAAPGQDETRQPRHIGIYCLRKPTSPAAWLGSGSPCRLPLALTGWPSAAPLLGVAALWPEVGQLPYIYIVFRRLFVPRPGSAWVTAATRPPAFAVHTRGRLAQSGRDARCATIRNFTHSDKFTPVAVSSMRSPPMTSR
jgi:hypothetical protein